MVKKLAVFLLFLIAFSCENREPAEPTIPDWLKPRLEELVKSGDCHGCTLQQSTYNEGLYYHLYCSYWSCSHCEVYDEDGNLIEWSNEFPLSNWLENRTKLVILWQCGDPMN